VWLIRSALRALYPGRGEVPGIDQLDLDDFLARYRREAPAIMWVGLHLAALVFTLSPLVTIGWPLPSIWLSPSALDRHAYAATTHRWYLMRQLVMVLKMAGGLCWGQHPRVRALHGVAAYGADPGTWRAR
jgi:hypothetical protein